MLSEVVNAEPFYKPVPQPRSKKTAQLDETRTDTVLEVSQSHRTPSTDSHSDSHTHENLQCVSGERSPDETHSKDTPPARTDSHSQGDSEDGNFNSNPQHLLVVLH